MQVKMKSLLSQSLLVLTASVVFIVSYSFAAELCLVACETMVLTNDCIGRECISALNNCTTDCFVTYNTGPLKARQCKCKSPNSPLFDQYWQKRKYDCTYPRDGIDDCICIHKWYSPKDPTTQITCLEEIIDL